LVAAAVAFAVAGCGGSSTPPAEAGLHVDRFNRDRAFADLRHQVELGPRPAKSPAARKLARWLKGQLPHGRIEKVRGGYENVVGRIGASRGKPIVLAAHYDTKDQPGFVGANDGAGGTAGVLEIARALRNVKGLPPIRFVLFDGEESPDDNADFYTTGPTLTFNFLSSSLAQDLTYTMGWAAFAVAMLIIGIVVHTRGTRVAALILLVVTILKCFLHDLGRLGGLYRVVSLLGLAISLVLVGILLQKFVIMRPREEEPAP